MYENAKIRKTSSSSISLRVHYLSILIMLFSTFRIRYSECRSPGQTDVVLRCSEDEENLARFFCKVASLSTYIYIQMVPLGFLGFRQFQNEGTSYFSLSLFTGVFSLWYLCCHTGLIEHGFWVLKPS